MRGWHVWPSRCCRASQWVCAPNLAASSRARRGRLRLHEGDSIAGALAIARESAVHVLLGDLRLKDGMGWDLRAHLHDKGKIPGIMMSGYADEAYITRSKKAGFAEYLVKPVDGKVPLSAISRMLDQSPTE